MGSWDELCIFCGVAPSGGPVRLTSHNNIDEEAERIVQDIRKSGFLDEFTDVDVTTLVSECLRYTLGTGKNPLARPAWIPKGTSEPDRDCIAIGHFDSLGDPIFKETRVPTGWGVEVQAVCNGSSGGFHDVWVGKGDNPSLRDFNCSVTVKDNPNFFLCRHCFFYLESWLARHGITPDWDMRSQDPSDGRLKLVFFAGLLYEIVNSRKQKRDEISGLLPEIDYDGIEASLEQWQSCFMPCRRGAKHIARAIQQGRRCKELVPALLKDCRTWLFADPTMWPNSLDFVLTPTVFRREFKSTSMTSQSKIDSVPNELLLQILRDLPLPSLFALSATCRSLRTVITEPSFLDVVLKQSLSHGELYWILPVASMESDKIAAYEAMRLWLPEETRPPSLIKNCAEDLQDDEPSEHGQSQHGDFPEGPKNNPPATPIILAPGFPRFAFLQACWKSDSMRCRERLWKQTGQFATLWKDFRSRGWQVNRFIPDEEPEEEGNDDNDDNDDDSDVNGNGSEDDG